jgi:hypothetical protein
MKNILVSSLVFEMLTEIAKKKKVKTALFLETLIKNEYLRNQ